ncbi:MAG: hypothetical protein VKK62_03600 [Synechococcaceae cyanobacterium]|nr:hypothetical protein [Synechococcaceae cyanobacterium]
MTDTSPVLWSLPSDLLHHLEQQARSEGISPQDLAVRLLAAGVEPEAGGSGRCSLRIGLSSEGPRPLPLQQP